MPSSKLAFFRYLLIDRMLRDRQHQYPTKQDLLEACEEKFGVRSISTIEKDLNAMRLEFDAPVEYNKRMKGYYYSDSSFKLLSVNLTEENLVALGFVETFLEEFRFMPIFGEFSNAIDKVLDGLEITRNFGRESMAVDKFIQIDKSPYFKGSDNLSQLIQVIADQNVIQIEYRKFNAETDKAYTVHPYLLKEFKNLWYLVGYVVEYKEVRTFGVDRITSFAKLDEAYLPKEKVGFDADNFFKNCYGITALNKKHGKIVLSFTPFLGNYVKAQPIHSSQNIVLDNEDELRIELDLVFNFELKNLILSYGNAVKVLEPASVKEEIKKELLKAAQQYD